METKTLNAVEKDLALSVIKQKEGLFIESLESLKRFYSGFESRYIYAIIQEHKKEIAENMALYGIKNISANITQKETLRANKFLRIAKSNGMIKSRESYKLFDGNGKVLNQIDDLRFNFN